MLVQTHAPSYATSTPLAQSQLDVTITDLIAAYELRHTFRNTGDEAIEAVYSFPVPLDAAFCGMTATLAGQTRHAQVMPAATANRNYDTAIAEGDSAVLLEALEPGLLCVNLGNLLPGEEGEIHLRFAAALSVADHSARFSLPLAYRPRYGRTRLDLLETPQHNFAVEHPLQAHIRIRGLLAQQPVLCNIGAAQFSHAADETSLQLPQAALDRDLVLSFELGHKPASRLQLLQDAGGQPHDRIALLHTSIPTTVSAAHAASAGRDICLLLDCSGSMHGDAIVQSRQALQAVADGLQAGDRIQVIRFGSSVQPLFRRPMPATALVKTSLYELIDILAADLDGTEIGLALDEALCSLGQLDGPAEQKAIILVTDGAVAHYEIEGAQTQAEASGIRIFTVAVGSSAGADVLAPLSQATQATMERAVPAEPIDQAVMRQFRRARSLPVAVQTHWGQAQVLSLPAPVAYPGDAITLVARCHSASLPQAVQLAFNQAGQSEPLLQSIPCGAEENLPELRAWAGQQIYQHAPEGEQEALALHYGLISPHTKALLVVERAFDAKATELPQVQAVPHMMPHGMGLGAVDAALACAMPAVGLVLTKVSKVSYDASLPMPMFCRNPVDVGKKAAKAAKTPQAPSKRSVKAAAPKSQNPITTEQKNALATLLAQLVLQGQDEVESWQIEDALEPTLLDQTMCYWLAQQFDILGEYQPIVLLQKLLDEGAQPALAPEQMQTLQSLLGAI